MHHDEVYNVIHRELTSQGFDADYADKEAQAVVQALVSRSELDLERLKDKRRRERRDRLERLRTRSLWVVAVGALVSGLAFGGHKLASSDDTDYAGYPPERVLFHSDEAIAAFFGQNDLPEDPKVVGEPERGLLRGKKVWKVTFEDPTMCVQVWEDSGSYTNLYEIREGEPC